MKRAHLNLTHHFTASGLVLCANHILLVNHKRIGAWVPPGGHVEPDEMPEETVVRELLEETGLHVEVLSPALPDTGDEEAFFLSSPLYMQSVLAIEKSERFYHVDMAYLCRPTADNEFDSQGLPLIAGNPEVKEARWVPRARVGELPLAKNVAEALSLLDWDGNGSRLQSPVIQN
jgi:8-oxo-dGTP pyrophosphatase MutT (NUDIX family)